MSSLRDGIDTDHDTRQSLVEHEGGEEPQSCTNSSTSGSQESQEKHRMERFYWHSLCLCLIPPLVAAYFIVIWRVFLSRDLDAVKVGSAKEKYIYYSWFIIGVFGIGWSKYGLAGVEMAMLQSRRFGALDTETLIMHSGKSWSGPDGWLRCLSRLLRGEPIHAHRLWYLLSVISVLPFVAFPISGLCMELSDGFILSAAHPMTIGSNMTNFNNKQYLQTVERGRKTWESGSSGQLPGIGILYTPDYLSRDQFDGLDKSPNMFPRNGSVPEVFVAPQAQVPIAGRVWGLRLGYNCSVVDDISQMSLVTDKARVSEETEKTSPEDPYTVLKTGTHGSVYVYNSTSKRSSNLFGYLEMGISNGTENLHYDGTEPNTFNPGDSSKADILEWIIWQARVLGGYEADEPDFTFNDTINEPVRGAAQAIIRDANGTFRANSSFFDPAFSPFKIEDYAHTGPKQVISLAPPVGLRCVRFSAVGYADLDAKSSSFRNFKIGPYPYFDHSKEEIRVQRFGYAANNILLQQYSNIFDSISLPVPMTSSNSVLYGRFLQARELQQSAMLAHAIDALQLMYDGVSSFEHSNINSNLTSSHKGKVLTPGIVPALFPAILFLVWAIGCLMLGLGYGFVRRWSDTLEVYYLLSIGADFDQFRWAASREK